MAFADCCCAYVGDHNILSVQGSDNANNQLFVDFRERQ